MNSQSIEALEAQYQAAVAETMKAEEALIAAPVHGSEALLAARVRSEQANQNRDRLQRELAEAHARAQ